MSSSRVTFDDLYRRSTQYRIWSFTKDELAQVREQANEKGRQKVDERLKEHPDVDAALVEKLTVDEELDLIAFHLQSTVAKLASLFNMPSQVRATATSFFRKFYLVHSVMEYHPRNVLLTCLFLAAKSENYFIGINTFCKRVPKSTPESILALEFTILETLKFTLFTHHPFRPLYGFFFDIQDTLSDVSPKELGTIYDHAKNLINDALISDVVYHFTPPQIALACFKEIDNAMTTRYLDKKFNHTIKEEPEAEEDDDDQSKKEQVPRTDYELLLNVIHECQVMLKTARKPTRDQAVLMDKKCHYCLNPALTKKRKRENGDDAADEEAKRQHTAEPEGTPSS